MKRLLAISLVILVITPATLRGQADDILFSGNYQDVPFGEFVNDVEQKTGVTFYYLERWVRGVRVTASGDEISLRRTLDRTLLPAGLYYYLEDKSAIYLSDRQPLVKRLPDYSGNREHLCHAVVLFGAVHFNTFKIRRSNANQREGFGGVIM